MTFAGGLLIVAIFSHSSENRCSSTYTPKSIASKIDISGKWQITQNTIKDGSVETWTIAFQQVGNRAFGTIVSQRRNTDLVATLDGNTLSFAVRTPIGTVEMAGIVNGD